MIDIYTDGSCLGNPGKGGWAAVSENFSVCGHLEHTTNNIAEMTAIVKALEYCVMHDIKETLIFTDSNYVKQGITLWIKNWKRNGWKTALGQDVKNKNLWVLMDSLSSQLHVEFRWVKAHNGNLWNEKADALAKKCALQV